MSPVLYIANLTRSNDALLIIGGKHLLTYIHPSLVGQKTVDEAKVDFYSPKVLSTHFLLIF